MALTYLIYVSSALKKQSDAELEAILESSVRNNKKNNVTGMLLYADGNFLQILEGEEVAIDEIFKRVEKDPRHRNIIVMDRDVIQQRSFEKWNMGFRLVNEADILDKPVSYAPFFKPGFDPVKLGIRPGLALEILLDFSDSRKKL